VIEAQITVTVDEVATTEMYRLVTSLLDPRQAPAAELVALYARRWAVETGIREIKTVLLGGRGLRGATPARVMQEIWAVLSVYQGVRLLIAQAATRKDVDPADLSFTGALGIVAEGLDTTSVTRVGRLEPLYEALADQRVIKHARFRIFPRAVRPDQSRYPIWSRDRPSGSTNASYRIEVMASTGLPPPDPVAIPTLTSARPRAA
jgi:hypothetical protein